MNFPFFSLFAEAYEYLKIILVDVCLLFPGNVVLVICQLGL